MAKFVETGLSGLMLSLEELAKLPDEVIGEMLMAEGKVVERYQREEIDRMRLVDSGRLKASIQTDQKYRVTGNGKEYYINVYPRGAHHTYRGRLKTKTYKRSKSGRTYTYGGGTKTATTQDVGFVHEFGAKGRGIRKKGWMMAANLRAESEAVAAAEKVLNDYLDKLGL